MDQRPKRRKHKDNPYTLISYNKSQYFVSFNFYNKKEIISISKEIFQTLDRFELDDLRELNEFDNHIEHSEIFENNLNSRAFIKETPLDELVEKKLLNEQLYEALNELPDIQKRRIIKYYFEDMTLKDIANIEECSIMSVKNSIDIALKKLKKILKK